MLHLYCVSVDVIKIKYNNKGSDLFKMTRQNRDVESGLKLVQIHIHSPLIVDIYWLNITKMFMINFLSKINTNRRHGGKQ